MLTTPIRNALRDTAHSQTGSIIMMKGLITIALFLLGIFANAQSYNFGDKTYKNGDTLLTYQIAFDLAKWDITEHSQPFLDSLIDFLNINETLDIEITNHNDFPARKESSTSITQYRADALKSYLINSGIEASRIKAIGYENDYPIYDWEYIDSLPSETEKQKAQTANRRTEIIFKTQPNIK